jgi:hypothetical protein
LEEAEDAHLTTEEAANYLKSVLGMEKNPTDATSLKTPNGDAQGEKTMVTHGQPWITVTRHRTKRVKAEQRPPKVGEGRACQNWRAEPGFYGAWLQESYPSIATNTTKPKDKKKNRMKKMNKKNHKKAEMMYPYLDHASGYRMHGTPHYLVEQLDKLNIEEFIIALEYWMNSFNFTNEQCPILTDDSTGALYDESRYPNAQYKPSGNRFKPNERHTHTMAKRNQALTFASKTLSELHRHNGPPPNASASGRTMQAKRNRIFAATYKEACDIDPYGHKIFLEGIPRNNQINYLLIEQRKRAQKHIRAWNQHTNLPPIQDPYTHIPIVNYPRGLKGIPRQHEMVKSGYQMLMLDRATIDA